MSRTYSREAEPHRDLYSRKSGHARGADVEALQAATRRRLGARNIDREFKIDGELGPETLAAVRTALRYLGAQESTYKAPRVTIGAQRMIRYPGRRTPAQIELARDRVDALSIERVERAKAKPSTGRSLTARQRAEARDRAVDAMRLLFEHRGVVHYTQGARRWEGIDRALNAREGEFPRYADCSSSTTWALWCGLYVPFHLPDVVNGQGWRAGYTGTQLVHGTRVSFDALRPADLILYGVRGAPSTQHVAMIAEDTRKVYSHGSEAGPFLLPIRYRADVLEARRYI